jgi:hypothetical protein
VTKGSEGIRVVKQCPRFARDVSLECLVHRILFNQVTSLCLSFIISHEIMAVVELYLECGVAGIG